MKKISFLTLAVSFALAPTVTFAATHNRLDADATNNANTSSASAAQNAGNAQNINFNSTGDGHSVEDVHTIPGVAGNNYYGSFSPSSCMVSGGVGFAVFGFGANGVTPIQDSMCNSRQDYLLLKQTAAGEHDLNRKVRYDQAADDVLCAQGGDVYESMYKQGLCSIRRDKNNGKSEDWKGNDAQYTQAKATPVASSVPNVKVRQSPVSYLTPGQTLSLQEPLPQHSGPVVPFSTAHISAMASQADIAANTLIIASN